MISTIFLVFAFVLAAIAAVLTAYPDARGQWGSRMGWASLACFYLSILLGGAGISWHR